MGRRILAALTILTMAVIGPGTAWAADPTPAPPGASPPPAPEAPSGPDGAQPTAPGNEVTPARVSYIN
jgi:hypothetical protein